VARVIFTFFVCVVGFNVYKSFVAFALAALAKPVGPGAPQILPGVQPHPSGLARVARVNFTFLNS